MSPALFAVLGFIAVVLAVMWAWYLHCFFIFHVWDWYDGTGFGTNFAAAHYGRCSQCNKVVRP